MSWLSLGQKYDDIPSQQWAITTSLGASAGAGFSVGITSFYLLNVKSQVYRPGRFIELGAGAGVGIRGLTLSLPSWTFIWTSEAVTPDEFVSFASIVSGDIEIVTGGNLMYVTFWGVHHTPHWIDLGGSSMGASVGVALNLVCSSSIVDEPRKVPGFIPWGGV